MYQKQSLLLLAVLPFLWKIEACSVRNATCYDLKTKDGYRYAINATDSPTQIQASHNGTIIGIGELGTNFRFSAEVVKMDNHSVTTNQCKNLQITLIFYTKEGESSNICERFNIEKESIPEAPNSSTAWKTIVGVVVAAVVVVICVALGYVLWKKKRKGEGTLFPAYVKQHTMCSCFRKKICDEDKGSEPIRYNELIKNQNMHNQNMHNSQQEQQQGLLPTGNSSDAEADDKTSLRINMDHNLTTANGDAGSPGVIGAVVPQGVNGNVWHAPDDGTEEHSNGNKLDGGTLGEQGPEGFKSNGAVLPRSERAARRRVDETGETEALVNMLGSSSECTTPPRDIDKGVTTTEEK